ncbi:Chromatin structure-remodeling complex subunit rsc9 [Purpureocillium lavendulum]|uniref:Chromatin structure-remodeling complex subunit rsc9 n=1 Tax=Purpureocillium lavendulum TaxID=1247861 RepID=A0AB34FH98_9HYPO|nr:Chromatin structure-remodeling complex subunit rsc9 [Purpureocillium lavendulum]
MFTLDGTRQYIRRNVFKTAKSQDSIPAPFLNGDGFVDFGPYDPSNPRNWSTARKWYITLCASFLAMVGNIASSIPSGCLRSISKELHVSEEAAGLSLTLYLLGYCAGPFLFAPISEFYGRRIIFRTTFPVYLAFSVLCAFAPNFGALLVGRFLAGTFVSAVLSNTPGVLADVWDHMERGNAMAIFSTSVWAGPSLGPIISGFLVLHKDWRWGFYVVACVSGLAALFMLTIPETNGSIILIERARRVRKARVSDYEGVQTKYEAAGFKLLDIYRTALTRPWALMLDTISLLCSIYMAVIFTLQYMLFTIYSSVFQDMRGWNEGVGQLPLLGTVVGAVPGALIIFYDTKRRRDKLKAGFDLEPEDRLTMSMVGGAGFAAAMFWFAWTAQYNEIHWLVPTIAGGLLSVSLILTFVSYLNYLVDSYVHYAASAIAVNTFARSIGSASAPLFTTYMFKAMGVGGGGSLIGGVAAVLAIVPFVFWRYGKKIRGRSNYTPSDAAVKADPEVGTPHPANHSLREFEEDTNVSRTGSNPAEAHPVNHSLREMEEGRQLSRTLSSQEEAR